MPAKIELARCFGLASVLHHARLDFFAPFFFGVCEPCEALVHSLRSP